MNRLFVYGIFLNEYNRHRYLMHDPQYAVVNGYKTILKHEGIVEAIKDPQGALTGLVVKLPENYDWRGLDRLEWGYKRILVTTSLSEYKSKTWKPIQAYMYVKGKNET